MVRLFFLLVGVLALVVEPLPATAAPRAALADFTGWHLPLPAGEWLISRGSCNAATPYDHDCTYYEERCALDLIAVSDSMEDMPVLAPQAGRVFFMGTRDDAGLTLMLQHSDGRVSAFMHLSKIVVGLDEALAQGQVIGYAGSTGSSGNPHLHFFVQPNAVERECLPLDRLDEIDFLNLAATSRNLGWNQLVLTNPPQALLDRLPPLSVSRSGVLLPTRLALSPGVMVRVPLALTGALTATTRLTLPGRVLTPLVRTNAYTLFRVPIAASWRGESALTLFPHLGDGSARDPGIRLRYSVRPPIDASPAQGLIWINPELVSPARYTSLPEAPELCWSLSRSAGQAPLEFRVVVAGPTPADSGWIGGTCWQSPGLAPGTYYWKVFVRDARGYMNRTNQRPAAFIIH